MGWAWGLGVLPYGAPGTGPGEACPECFIALSQYPLCMVLGASRHLSRPILPDRRGRPGRVARKGGRKRGDGRTEGRGVLAGVHVAGCAAGARATARSSAEALH